MKYATGPTSTTNQLSHHPSVSSMNSWSGYPGQQQQYQQPPVPPGSSSNPGPSRPGGLAGTAYGYIDKFGGKKVLGELEGRVGNLANQGSKLWGKFTK